MEAAAARAGGRRVLLLPLLPLLALQALQAARAQTPPASCPPEHDTWVKMTALMPVTLAPHYRVFMYSSPGNAVTAECYNRCRESGDCRAFLVDHARSACFRVSNLSPVSWDQPGDTPVAAAPASTYFERACVDVRGGGTGSRCAARAWAAERVPGYELVGWDRLTIASPVSRAECLQECIKPHDGWECRSARWDSRTGACYLSAEDRRSQPDAFRAGPWGVEYLENECAEPPAAAASCAYQEFANVSMVIADLQITGLDREQCQARCDAETNFRCRGFSLRPPGPGRGAAWLCVLHGDDTISAGPSALYPLPGALYAERAACIDLRVSCSRRHMTVTLQSPGPFQGRLFVLGRSDLCGAEGRGATSTSLTLPLDPEPARLPGPGVNDRCGLRLARAFGRADGDANRTLVSAVVVVQRNPIIQTRGDRAVRVGCILAGEEGPPQNLTLGASIAVANPEVDNNGTAVLNVSSSAPTVRLRITDLSGREQPLHETQLGDTLQLRIDVSPDTSPWGVRATHLVASSADGQDSYLLLDSRGCPPDPHTFPGLRPVEPGARSLAATFRAFKFPSSALVRFGLKVHFCRGGCAPVNCGAGIASSGRRRRRAGPASPATAAPAVPEDVDYPMQLAIVVHTPRVLAANAGASASGIITIDSVNRSDGRVEEMVCMTGGTLVALAASALLLQAVIQMVCMTGGTLVALAAGALLLQAVILVVCCVGARRHIASHEKQLQAYTNPAWAAASTEDRRVTWADQ